MADRSEKDRSEFEGVRDIHPRSSVERPTPELRFVERRNTGEDKVIFFRRILQQKWILNMNDDTEWRDVPIEEE